MSSSIKDNSPEDAKISPFPDEKLELAGGDERSIDKSDALVTDDTQVLLIDHHAERRLVWKFDTRILPVLAVMYLFNSLDKSNLGNAKTDGLETTLNLTGDQYNIILSVFFVPYVLTAPILAILGKKYGPNRVLPIMMFCFGFVTTMVMVVKNFGGLMTIRWFLGMAESAFFPLVIYYQTTYPTLPDVFSDWLSIGSIAEGNLLDVSLFFTPPNQSPPPSAAFLLSASSRFIPVLSRTGVTFSLLKAVVPWPFPSSRFGICHFQPRGVLS